MLLEAFLDALGLTAVSTFAHEVPLTQVWAHEHYVTKARRVIDYVCSNLAPLKSTTSQDDDFASDHR